jgi:hypothetical protein
MREPSPRSRQKHLHLHRCGVLRLVEQDAGVGQRATAHEGERGDLDHAGLHAALDDAPFHEIMQRVVDRPQIGIDLVAHVAGQEAEALAGLHRGTRQDEPLDHALLQQRYRVADGEPGLAGAGRPFGEDEFVMLEGAQIEILIDCAGAHGAALARAELLEHAATGLVVSGEQIALNGAFLNGAVDIAQRQPLALPDAGIKIFEHAAGVLGRFRRTLDRHMVAVGVGDHAQTTLDLGEILVIFAENHRGEAIVIEGERDFRAFQKAGSVGIRHARASPGGRAAARTANSGRRRCDLDPPRRADQRLGPVDLNGLKPGRLAGDLARMAAFLLEQNVEGPTDRRPIEVLTLSLEQNLKAGQTFGLDRLGDLIGHVGAGRAGAWRIFERKGAGEADRPDQIERILEIPLGLAGKADDEIRRQSDIRPRRANTGDEIDIGRRVMLAVHGGENAVRP